MEAKLKSVITQAAESNNLDSVNWADLPLPQQMLQEERTRSLLTPSSVAFSRPSPSPPAPFVRWGRRKGNTVLESIL